MAPSLTEVWPHSNLNRPQSTGHPVNTRLGLNSAWLKTVVVHSGSDQDWASEDGQKGQAAEHGGTGGHQTEKQHVEKKYFHILLWELRVEGLFLSFLWQILSFLLCRLKLKGTIRLPALAAPSSVIRRTGLGASWLAWDYLLNVFLQIAPLRAPSSSVVVHVQTDKKAHSRDTSWLSLPSMCQAPIKHFFSP